VSGSVSALQGSGDPPVGGVIDPAARPVRRSFTAEYRARVVAEYEGAARAEGCGAAAGGPVSVPDPGMGGCS